MAACNQHSAAADLQWNPGFTLLEEHMHVCMPLHVQQFTASHESAAEMRPRNGHRTLLRLCM
eukprot:1790770-Pleurochrysis_carterae.AAC.2